MAHILCFVEVRETLVRKASLEAVSVARGLATTNGWAVEAAVVGPAGADQLDKVKAAGADVIHHAADASLALYSPDLYAAALLGLIGAAKPEAVLMGHTAMGRDLSAWLAGKLQTAAAGDCVKVEFAGGFKVVRPMYAGKALATVAFNAGFIPVITLRPNIFPVGSDAGRGEVKPLAAPAGPPKTVCAGLEKPESQELDVAEADVIVSGGRAMKGPENFAILKELAAELGAAVGASRAAVDSGWIGHPHQVGQTGKTVSPNLYIACGISGAIQHLAGMSSSKCIVAINKDKDAPIFQAADYGVLGDLFQIVPQVTEALKTLKKEG